MPQVLRVDPGEPDPAVIREAAEMIRAGWSSRIRPTRVRTRRRSANAGAVKRLCAHGRAETSALTLIAADLAHVRAAGEMTPEAERLAARWWPGPLTIVVRASGILARETLAGGHTVGIRIPAHVVALALARDAGFSITATSANRSGEAAASTADAVAAALPDVDAVIDAGPVRGGAPSTIVDASTTPLTLLRPGVVPWDKVLRSLQ
jgi:L-threonylcarbamoyladenylate synthase